MQTNFPVAKKIPPDFHHNKNWKQLKKNKVLQKTSLPPLLWPTLRTPLGAQECSVARRAGHIGVKLKVKVAEGPLKPKWGAIEGFQKDMPNTQVLLMVIGQHDIVPWRSDPSRKSRQTAARNSDKQSKVFLRETAMDATEFIFSEHHANLCLEGEQFVLRQATFHGKRIDYNTFAGHTLDKWAKRLKKCTGDGTPHRETAVHVEGILSPATQ